MSHVIEHLEDPEQFVREAKRCAKYVYLEFPARPLELMYAWSFHRWLVEIRDGTLLFFRNDLPQLFGGFFHENYDFLLDQWSQERFEKLNSRLFVATDELRYEICGQTATQRVLEDCAHVGGKVNYRSEYGNQGVGRGRYSLETRLRVGVWATTPSFLIRLRNRLLQRRNRMQRRELTDEIAERLLCQACRKGRLRMKGEKISCVSCGRCYQSTQGIFDFDV